MRIVLPVHHFPPTYSAGAELYTYRLARWLNQHGHQAEVVCVERVDLDDGEKLRAVQDEYDGVPVWRLSLDLRRAPFAWSYDNPLIGRWMRGYLESFGPDLLHLQSGYLISASPLFAARDLGVPTLVTLHDFWFLCPRITLQRGDGSLCATLPEDPAACGWCARLAGRRYRLPNQLSGGMLGAVATRFDLAGERADQAMRRARLVEALASVDRAIAPSRFLAGRYAGFVPAERLHVMRLGLDRQALATAGPPPDDGVMRLGYIGQIAPHKGVHVLVRALQRVPRLGQPIELTIYGNLAQNPEYTARLQRMIGDDPRIRLAGPFDNRQAAEVLGRLHAIVVPSLWYENSPLAIQEAQAAGRPVLTSALGGMAELVRDGIDGLHFRPGDADDLARQIQRLRVEPGLLARLRSQARPPVTIDEEMPELLGLYEGALARARVVG